MANKPHERRQQRRQALELLISYEADNKRISNFSFDLSSGGIFIETTRPLPSGTSVSLMFELPHDRSRYTVDATVTWTREDHLSQPAGMGLRFNFMPNDPKNELLQRAISVYEKLSKKTS